MQADRGEDLGVVTESFNLQAFMERRFAMRAYMDEEDQNVGYIIRIASSTETKLLPEKFQDEEMIFKVGDCYYYCIVYTHITTLLSYSSSVI